LVDESFDVANEAFGALWAKRPAPLENVYVVAELASGPVTPPRFRGPKDRTPESADDDVVVVRNRQIVQPWPCTGWLAYDLAVDIGCATGYSLGSPVTC
jgi:hypothetical protein